jgi:hypothetical protein
MMLYKVVKEREWANALRNGYIRMSHLGNYVDSIGTPGYDNDEGLFLKDTIGNYTISFNGKTLDNYISLKCRHDDILKYPISCLSMIYAPSKFKPADPEKFLEELKIEVLPNNDIYKFGEYVFLVTNVPKFLNKVKNKLNKLNYTQLEYRMGPISYNDNPGLIQNDAGFIKNASYSNEKEYRIMIKDSTLINPYILEIGNCKDISIVVSVEEFLKYIHLNYLGK